MVEAKLRAGLAPAHLEVAGHGEGCGLKMVVTAVSAAFEGKPLLAQHRLVNALIEEERGQIHALTLKTFTPAKWEAKGGV